MSPGQKSPVNSYFLAYEQSLQSEELCFAVQKALNSMDVEGEIPEEGTSDYVAADKVYVKLAKQMSTTCAYVTHPPTNPRKSSAANALGSTRKKCP